LIPVLGTTYASVRLFFLGEKKMKVHPKCS
jgi:hypothetical protein